MKTVGATISLLFPTVFIEAQNVGIGTVSPNASAILHISSNNKGVLFPAVYLQSDVDNATVASPAPNLIVFNTNTGLAGGKACTLIRELQLRPIYQYW